MKFVKGDLLDAPELYIAHGCNAQGVMGSGVALAIKNKHPEAYLRYVKYIKFCNEHKTKALGQPCIVKSNDKIIINLVTQEFFGRDGKQYVDYDAIKSSMKDAIYLIRRLGEEPIKQIAIPKIGAGLGGGDWNIITEILLDVEKTYNVEFIVYALEN